MERYHANVGNKKPYINKKYIIFLDKCTKIKSVRSSFKTLQKTICIITKVFQKL